MKQTKLLDDLREEKFSVVFPELDDMKVKYNQVEFWANRE